MKFPGWAIAGALLPAAVLGQGNLIPSAGVTTGDTYGSVQKSIVTVTGQSFSRATRVRTLGSPANPYDVGLTLRTAGPVARQDVVSGEVWIRRIAPADGDAFVTFNFEKAAPNYDKSHSVTLVSGSTNWTRFRFAFQSVDDYAAGAAQVSFHLGFPAQTLELGGLVVTNHARTRSLSEFPNDLTYAGRESDAPWRTAAAGRIATHRQALLSVSVIDGSGNPVPGAQVEVVQLRHAFGFGTAVDGARLLGQTVTAADRARYQSYLTNWFNKYVLENDLKWPNWERLSPNGARTATNALLWFQARGLPVRGHNLIWPGTGASYFLPADVPPLLANPEALRSRIQRHFEDILGRTRGLCTEWDVINEALHETELEAVLGRQELAGWFQRARALDPAPALYFNEYENLESPTRAGTQRLLEFLRDLKARGAPVDGVGLQSHFGSFLTSPQEVYDRISLLVTPSGNIPAPVTTAQITEFDVNVKDEQVQADYLRDFVTIAFSHPQVNAVMLWGFWAGAHWIPDAALLRQNWQPKPSGLQWSNLVYREWWTHTHVLTDAQGIASVRAFKGDYRVRVTRDGDTHEQSVSLAADTPVTIPWPVASPELQVSTDSSGLRLAWSGSATGFRVETARTLQPPDWTPAGGEPVLAGGQWTLVLPPPDSTQFVRLRR
ncbi:MAG: endo-1,4-beta-xylanase [Verrucomicrobiales bacterium]|nr:endo-1,4-beta-xylanase [Verrucomicrobiales bacterium]